ncbi:hypothetical protein IPM62_01150 [Candidatus Woesebacteria bacterium]|nr:MAG: hypothetical protein IPM62_01150 [Candidatus Woesebacteria bacterium]
MDIDYYGIYIYNCNMSKRETHAGETHIDLLEGLAVQHFEKSGQECAKQLAIEAAGGDATEKKTKRRIQYQAGRLFLRAANHSRTRTP